MASSLMNLSNPLRWSNQPSPLVLSSVTCRPIPPRTRHSRQHASDMAAGRFLNTSAVLYCALVLAGSINHAHGQKLGVCNGAPFPWSPFNSSTAPLNMNQLATKGVPDDPTKGLRAVTLPRVRRTQGDSSGQWSPSPYCLREPRNHGMQTERQLSALALCLQNDVGCASSGARAEVTAAQAASLPSMKLLRNLRRSKVKCVSVTRTSRCGRLVGNVDTYLPVGKFYPQSARPAMDMPKKLAGTCALIANGPLTMLNRNGASIDAHSHVARFNAASVGSQTLRLGTRTTHRVFNRPRGSEASGCTRRRCTGIRTGMGQQLSLSASETWLFWNYESVSDFPTMKRLYRRVTPRLFSPDASRAVYQVYWQARRDLLALGLGPFNCPKALSSGIHAMILMAILCDQYPLSLYGFTYDEAQLRSRGGHYVSGGPIMFGGHSWTFDAAFVRLLHLAGHATVCTADDPTVKTAALRKGRAPRDPPPPPSSSSRPSSGGLRRSTLSRRPIPPAWYRRQAAQRAMSRRSNSYG